MALLTCRVDFIVYIQDASCRVGRDVVVQALNRKNLSSERRVRGCTGHDDYESVFFLIEGALHGAMGL